MSSEFSHAVAERYVQLQEERFVAEAALASHCVLSISFDETEHRVKLRGEQAHIHSLMMLSAKVLLCKANAANYLQDIAVPPCVLKSTTAEDIVAGIMHAPWPWRTALYCHTA